ncbi:MAG: thiosulfate oxidation carrier protein SoxY [Pseudomonadota bacterium]
MSIHRRSLLSATGAWLVLAPLSLRAAPRPIADLLRESFGARDIRDERVALSMPALAENGNSVALEVSVDSPMTDADHVREIHLFAEKNPEPLLARFHLSPASGSASVATRVRLADTQTVVAVATMNDGRLFAGRAETIVTEAACLDFLI